MARTGLNVASAIGLALALPFLAFAAPDSPAQKSQPQPMLTESGPEQPDNLQKENPPPVVRTTELSDPPLAPMQQQLITDVKSVRNERSDIRVSADGTTIELVGEITDGIANRLNGVLLQNPDARTLVLTSEGGILLEGAALAHLVRKNGLNTHVEFACASACTFPLLAGKERSIAPGALVGFHQASNVFSTLMAANVSTADDAGNVMMRSVYIGAQLSDPFVEKALATPPGDLWFPDLAMLQSNIVVTRVAKRGEFPMASSGWPSAAAFVAELESDPLWVSARQGRAENYALALATGWIAASRSKNKTAVLRSARASLVRRLLQDAPAYPDLLLAEFVESERKVWSDSAETFNLECDYRTRLRFPISDPKTTEQRAAQLAILQKMIAIKTDVPLPDAKMRASAQAELMAFWGIMIAEQSFSTFDVATNFCREPLSYFDEMTKMPEADRANLVRSLMLTQSSSLR